MKLKICGMKYPENILEVAALLPDYILLFWERSSRYFEGQILNKIHKKTGVQRIGAIIIEKILENNL
jgi:phosphoribosylanthranilate isomerase